MLILFEENEKRFDNLGIGVLSDTKSCIVKEKFKDEFSLTMEYPINGKLYNQLKIGRIIYSKPNPYSNAQAFKIRIITKPIKGIVTVEAVHISYDLNYIPAMAIDAININDALDQMVVKSLVSCEFSFDTDIVSARTFKTTAPYNLRAILMGGDESLIETYKAEPYFDNFKIKLMSHRGKDRNAEVRYGKNMTDLKHTSSADTLFKGVFPYYHTERSSNQTESIEGFKQVYIVGNVPFVDGWLSYSEGGEPYHPLDESPVQVATDGSYKEKVYCWDSANEIFVEKLYNQQVTLIQGALEPSWISIDWSQIFTSGRVVCRAGRNGYFKSSTSTDWGELRGVGDIIFEGAILDSGILQNIIIYYSEVIPDKSNNKNKEVTEVVDVNLADYDKEENKWNGDPIIWLETPDAKAVLNNSILMLDLSSEFDEEPTKDQLRTKANEYISKNKIGQIKHSTTVSFVDLASTIENVSYTNFDIIELGDTVRVIYEDLGVDVQLRVISTTYDALLDRYNSVELGEVEETLSGNSVQTGDNVSSLTNDADYSTVSNVNKLIANIVTAEFLEAVNAKLSNAQISQLATERINCTGIMEASQATIDNLVAKMLTSDNALIKETLEAGKIKVKGDVTVTSGEITITNGVDKAFYVDREGNVTANSIDITGGEINLNNGIFKVTNDGVLYATDGIIGGFSIFDSLSKSELSFGNIGEENSVVMSRGAKSTNPIAGETRDGADWTFTSGETFGVTKDGKLYSTGGKIGGLNIGQDSIYITEAIGQYNAGTIINTDNDFNYSDKINGKTNIATTVLRSNVFVNYPNIHDDPDPEYDYISYNVFGPEGFMTIGNSLGSYYNGYISYILNDDLRRIPIITSNRPMTFTKSSIGTYSNCPKIESMIVDINQPGQWQQIANQSSLQCNRILSVTANNYFANEQSSVYSEGNLDVCFDPDDPNCIVKVRTNNSVNKISVVIICV